MIMWFILFVVSLLAGSGLFLKYIAEKKKREEQRSFIIIGGILLYCIFSGSLGLLIFAGVCLIMLLSFITGM